MELATSGSHPRRSSLHNSYENNGGGAGANPPLTYHALHSLRGKDLATIYARKCEAARLHPSRRILHRLRRIDRHMTDIFDLSGIAPASSVSTFEIALECVAIAHAIREVSIRSTDATLREVELLVHYVSLNPSISVVDVSHNPRLDHHAARTLADLARHKPTLTSVVFDGCDGGFVNSNGAAALQRVLETNSFGGPHAQGRGTANRRGGDWNAGQPDDGRPAYDSLVTASTNTSPAPPPIVFTRCSSETSMTSSSRWSRRRGFHGEGGAESAANASHHRVLGGEQDGGSADGGRHHAERLDRCLLWPMHRVLRYLTWEHPTMSVSALSVCLVAIWAPLTTSIVVVVLLILFGKRPQDELLRATTREEDIDVDRETSNGQRELSTLSAVRGIWMVLVSPFSARLPPTPAMRMADSRGTTSCRPLLQLRLRVDDTRRRLRSDDRFVQAAAVRDAVDIVLNPFQTFAIRSLSDARQPARSTTPPPGERWSLLRRPWVLLSFLTAVVALIGLFVRTANRHLLPSLLLVLFDGHEAGDAMHLFAVCSSVVVLAMFSLDLWWHPVVRYLGLSRGPKEGNGHRDLLHEPALREPRSRPHRSPSETTGVGREGTHKEADAVDTSPTLQFVKSLRLSTAPQPLDHRYISSTPSPRVFLAPHPSEGQGAESSVRKSPTHLQGVASFSRSPMSQHGAKSCSTPEVLSPFVARGTEDQHSTGTSPPSGVLRHGSALHRRRLCLERPPLSPVVDAECVATCTILHASCVSRQAAPPPERYARQPAVVGVSSCTLRLCLLLWGALPYRFQVCFRYDHPRPGGAECAAVLWHKADDDEPVVVPPGLASGSSSLFIRARLFADGGIDLGRDGAPAAIATGTSPSTEVAAGWRMATVRVPLAVADDEPAGRALSNTTKDFMAAVASIELHVKVHRAWVVSTSTEHLRRAADAIESSPSGSFSEQRRTTFATVDTAGAAGSSSREGGLTTDGATFAAGQTSSSFFLDDEDQPFEVLYRGRSSVSMGSRK